MDVYWELSDFDIHTRQQGMEKLLESLKTLSTSDDNEKVFILIDILVDFIILISRIYHLKSIILFRD
jgi:hypothetical protein